jgi:hypothetical protein
MNAINASGWLNDPASAIGQCHADHRTDIHDGLKILLKFPVPGGLGRKMAESILAISASSLSDAATSSAAKQPKPDQRQFERTLDADDFGELPDQPVLVGGRGRVGAQFRVLLGDEARDQFGIHAVGLGSVAHGA